MSNLVEHAKRELAAAGYNKNSDPMDYDIYISTIEIVRIFSSIGHSGYSTAAHTHMIERILKFDNITPLTTDVNEWQLVEMGDDSRTHQNRRSGSCFSLDEGRTYYDIESPRLPKWKRPFVRNVHGFRLQITQPYVEKVST